MQLAMINSLPVTIEQQTQMFSEGPADPTENGVDSGESPKGVPKVQRRSYLRNLSGKRTEKNEYGSKPFFCLYAGERLFLSVERDPCRNVSVRREELRLRNTVLVKRDRIYGRIERTCCKGR